VIRAAANGGIVAASNAALERARGEFVGFLDHDDELAPDALAEVVARIGEKPGDAPGADVVYTDEDKIDPTGARRQAHFKPDWSPELLDSCMYVSHFTVMRRRIVLEAGGFRAGFDGSQDYDLMLRVAERTGRIAHVPRVLYGWRMAPGSAASSQLAKPWAVRAGQRALEEAILRRGLSAAVTSAGAAGHFRVRYAIAGAPVTSILMPSASTATAAAIQRTTRGRRIDIVAADPATPGGPLAARLNALARRATGDHLLFLHEDVEPCGPGWLDAMIEFSQQAHIGAVGPFLLRRDGTIDSAGLVLGAGGIAAGALQGAPGWTRGHLSNALDVRNCSAVSGACLLTRRDVFERLGGFDERFGEALFAVDYGLRLGEAGLRVVVTPHARVWHGPVCPHAAAADEGDRLRARWGRALDGDPYYNPAFDRRAATFRLPPAASPVE
jgi:GT2 family glycosyltransferase